MTKWFPDTYLWSYGSDADEVVIEYDVQEAMESFASPDYLFYGKSHIVQLYRKNGCKKPFLFAFNTTTTKGNRPKWNPA